MPKCIHRWLVTWLIVSGSWIVRRKKTTAGDLFQLVDMKRHIAYSWVLTHQLRENEWRIF